MNIIVANKQKDIIDNANIDAIKDFTGLFNVDDLISKIKNYFFSKIILDATSIVNFTARDVLEKLVKEIGADRLVVLLPSGEVPPKSFTDMLIDLKIYNYSTNIEDIVKFLSNPNTYENIMGDNGNNSSNNESFYVDSSIKANEDFSNMSLPEENVNIPTDQNEIIGEDDSLNNALNTMEEYNGDLVDNENPGEANLFVDSSVKNDEVKNDNNDDSIYQMTNNYLTDNDNTNNIQNEVHTDAFETAMNNTNFYSNSNTTNNVVNAPNDMASNVNNNGGFNFLPNNVNQNNVVPNVNMNSNKRVIGFRNVTSHAGSTTLVYLVKKTLKEKYHKNVLAVEVNKEDFKYYNDGEMISTSADNLRNIIMQSKENIIIVDLNDYYGNFDLINDVIYLVEPSVIKLNTLMMTNNLAFRELNGKKVVLNKSMLSSNDVKTLSNEAGIPMFMDIPPINDRVIDSAIIKLVDSLELS